MKILKNKFFILGNLLLILVVLPIILFFVKKQQEGRSRAAPTTILSFTPATKDAALGRNVDVDITVNPGQNYISIVDMDIRFDASKLEYVAITPNSSAFPVTLKGPTLSNGSVGISVNIGSNVTKAIQSPTKVATVTFKVLVNAPSGPTQLTFFTSQDPTKPTRVLSVAEPDGAGENVLASTIPGTINIGGGQVITPTQTSSPTPTMPSITITPAPTSAPVNNQIPICTGLSIDRDTTGAAPYSLTFTANGRDTDGVISKVSFDFGDGPIQTITQAGGIGTSTVSIQVSHTYINPGTYQASTFLTDNNGGISSSSAACSKTIIITQSKIGGGGNGNGGGTTQPPSTPIPTLPPTGSTMTTVGIIGGIVLTVIGGAVLLLL